jgi:3-carboxy-cis,cis-muconate cycloisomerase
MARNLGLEQGRLLAEAYLFQLAPRLGREAAHDLVYDAATRSKSEGIGLHEAVLETMRAGGMPVDDLAELVPAEQTGAARDEALAAVGDWRRSRRAA